MKPEFHSVRIYGVLERDGRILLARSVFRGREFVNFPGGGVDIGEGPRAALLREFREETGLLVEPVRVLYVSEGLHASTQIPIQITGVYWLVRETGGELRRGGNGTDVRELFWAARDAIPRDEMFSAELEFVERLPRLLDGDGDGA
jgi:ADP-ribose pyrophosphatase YjhB (NUDIX family)